MLALFLSIMGTLRDVMGKALVIGWWVESRGWTTVETVKSVRRCHLIPGWLADWEQEGDAAGLRLGPGNGETGVGFRLRMWVPGRDEKPDVRSTLGISFAPNTCELGPGLNSLLRPRPASLPGSSQPHSQVPSLKGLRVFRER